MITPGDIVDANWGPDSLGNPVRGEALQIREDGQILVRWLSDDSTSWVYASSLTGAATFDRDAYERSRNV